MSQGAWVSTASDALTAVAAAGGAVIGGFWTYFRYRREAPDVPRVNATVEASIIEIDHVDYAAVTVRLDHLSGGTLRLLRGPYDPKEPTVDIRRLSTSSAPGLLEGHAVTSAAALGGQAEFGSGEFAQEHLLVGLGARSPDTVGYDVELRFVAGWEDKEWTWCANALVRLADGSAAVGGSTVAPPK